MKGLPSLLALAKLGCTGEAIYCKRRQTLARQGSRAKHAYGVVSGMLRAVYQMPDKTRQITRFLMPGDVFGLEAAQVYDRSLEAVTDAQVQEYERRSIQMAAESNPRAAAVVFSILSKTLSDAKCYQVLIGQGNAHWRLARFLLEMADRQSSFGPRRKNTLVRLPMDRSQVADYLCLRHETVCRGLAELIDHHVIAQIDLHTLVLLDRETLERES